MSRGKPIGYCVAALLLLLLLTTANAPCDELQNELRGVTQDVVTEQLGPESPTTAASPTADSIPLLIVTNEEMSQVYSEYAWWKSALGTRALVVTLEHIDSAYSGASSLHRIRECLRDFHGNRATSYVLLGGDIQILPALEVNTMNDSVSSDQYFASLDHNWNENQNSTVGEPAFFGDTVDYSPELYVGRLPSSDSGQARVMIDKLLSYQTDTSAADYLTSALFTASRLHEDGDGAALNNRLAAYLPTAFSQKHHYNDPADSVIESLDSGFALIVNNSHAQNPGDFLTISPTTAEGIIYSEDIDSLTNSSRYGVFFNFTCYNNMLDSSDLGDHPTLSRHYMLNPTGGGAAYIGSTKKDWALDGEQFHAQILSHIFDSGHVRIGEALQEAKRILEPTKPWKDGALRYLYFATLLLGDPHMEVWTSMPQPLSLSFIDTVSAGYVSSTVTATSNGLPVEGVTVCISNDHNVYCIGTTSALGEKTFDSVYFTGACTATVGAKSIGYFPRIDTLEVEPCCVGSRGNIDGDPSDAISIGDLSVLIDHLFISLLPVPCLEEANVDESADANVSLGDLTVLIDHLFISLAPLPQCP